MSTEETTLFDVGEKVKRCTKCGQTKKLDAFHRSKMTKDGLRFSCRECDKEWCTDQRQRCAAENADRDPYDGTIKRCSGVCGRELPRTKDNWSTSPTRKDGLFHRCRNCNSGFSGDIIDRIEYLWIKEKPKNRGQWIHHGKAEWLDLLISQRGRCALSKVKLTPSNVSVDHIVPCSKGGSHELSNLRLVTAQVNKALWDGSDEDFIEMCRATINAQLNLLCYGTKENPGGETTGAEMRQS